MNLEVLIATVNQAKPFSLVEKMKLNSDAIIANQTDHVSYEEKNIKNNKIKLYNFKERGVGLNRNNALMRSDADIVLLADDDIKYIDNYKNIIIEEFKRNPKADMIVFNLETSDLARPRFKIKKYKRVRYYNCLRYGAVRMAFKLNKIREKNIYFSLLFGGGAKYSCGEDSLFILECIKKGIKVYSSPKSIGTINESQSTWFNGYNEKFFKDKGILFKFMYGKLAILLDLRFLIKYKKQICKQVSFFDAFEYMVKAKE